MSGIFGVFHFDGAPVQPETLATMRSAMDYWGPDGAGVWMDGSVALGSLRMHNTPESLYENLPLEGPASGITLTAAARIDNRAELLDAFEVPGPERSVLPDSALILQAYLRWGEECVHHLTGDWSFALWDARRRRLFIARDHHGNTSLYYHRAARTLAFASCQKALLALPEIPRRPNLLRVAQVLTSWQGDGVHSAYEGILHLRPAHAISATAEGLEMRRYWFPENLPELRLGCDDEYVEKFLEVYGEAVRSRLRCHRPVGATMSGGLDSGSASALAARELRARGQRFPVFTSVPVHDTNGLFVPRIFANELPWVEATSRLAGNMDVHPVRAADASLLSALDRWLDLSDGPAHASANLYWILALLGEARERGLGAVITGQCGNGTVSWAGPLWSVWPLVRRGEWSPIRRELGEAVGEEGWPHTLWQYALKPLLRPLWRRRTRWAHPFGRLWLEYSAIRPQFARSLDLERRMAEDGHDPSFCALPFGSRAERLSVNRFGRMSALGAMQEVGAGYGLELRDPTADRRVIEFCMAIPDSQYGRRGRNRWLMRRAMRGLLAEEVRLNTRKGLQAADIAMRVRDSRPEIAAALAKLETNPLARQALDLPRMSGVLAALDRSIDLRVRDGCVKILLRGLQAGLFLSRF
jgi:asparagine synthase (glutamine-hydrolysing)